MFSFRNHVVLFNENPCIVAREVANYFLNGFIGRVGARRHTKIYYYLFGRVVLKKGGGKAFVEERLAPFAGADDCDMGDVVFWFGEDSCLLGDLSEVNESVETGINKAFSLCRWG